MRRVSSIITVDMTGITTITTTVLQLTLFVSIRLMPVVIPFERTNNTFGILCFQKRSQRFHISPQKRVWWVVFIDKPMICNTVDSSLDQALVKKKKPTSIHE